MVQKNAVFKIHRYVKHVHRISTNRVKGSFGSGKNAILRVCDSVSIVCISLLGPCDPTRVVVCMCALLCTAQVHVKLYAFRLSGDSTFQCAAVGIFKFDMTYFLNCSARVYYTYIHTYIYISVSVDAFFQTEIDRRIDLLWPFVRPTQKQRAVCMADRSI